MTKPPADAFLLERPFGRAAELILAGWWDAADVFAQTDRAGWRSRVFAETVSRCFKPLTGLPTQDDPHITDGILDTLRTVRVRNQRRPVYTRPYLLLLDQFEHSELLRTGRSNPRVQADKHNRPKQYLYSPFYLLRQMLTSPDFSTSDAYAHALIRAEIFSEAIVFSKKTAKRKTAEGTLLTQVQSFINFEKVSKSVQKAESYRRHGDTFYAADATDFIIGHLLASRGLALLTFAPGDETYKPARVNERSMIGRSAFLRGRSVVPNGTVYEFRFVDDVKQLPSAAELVNELDGVPLAIPGMDVIFARGLRKTTDRGVVGRISGVSGSGKTSLALAFATAMAPLGITTRYISCEEDPEDLVKRVVTLTPPFVSRTKSFESNLSNWFHAVHLDRGSPQANHEAAWSLIDDMRSTYEGAGIDLASDSPPGLSPLLVVFDGVHELIERGATESGEQVQALHDLIENFRLLGAMIFILSAESDEPALRELDYMVDFVVRLEQLPGQANGLDTVRRLVLHKTRLQFSRTGSHLLHISKRDGVRVFPHLSAQLEMYSNLKWKAPDKSSWYDFLQVGSASKDTIDQVRPLVRIYDKSQVLVTGKGSGGKAGFALKLLTKPLVSREKYAELPLEPERIQRVDHHSRRRILIVSFLYEREYYQDLYKDLSESQRFDSTAQPSFDVKLDVLSLYPGYLSAEVLVNKIISFISKAKLEGESYHAVLIDGLHNVFLQYPFLQDSTMVWPVIFEIFRTIGVTVVVTHTRFEVRGMDTDAGLRWDVEAATRRVGPLLQSLVNSADFYIDLSPRTSGSLGEENSLHIEVVSALGQDVKISQYFWDRANSYVQFRTLKYDD